MAICKDENGNIIPCDKIKGKFKTSDDLSKGTQMKTIRRLSDGAKTVVKR